MSDAANKAATSRPIVVGVDGSEPSKAALRWALAQAKLTGDHLEVVSTWEYPTNYGWAVPIPEGIDFEADTSSALEETVREVLAADPHPAITTTVIEGHPAPILAERSRTASLLVVGCRGHGAFTGMLLGSVSEFLAAHAHCPVVIVRDGDTGHE